jgi:exopolyphosphatase / guanosine-5'-triphosphate,3'-diphosphate pyrophosphatase
MSALAPIDSAPGRQDRAAGDPWSTAWRDLAADPSVERLRALPVLPQVDLLHSVQVTRLALTLFDALAVPLDLAAAGRHELAAAAFWHDSGQSISEQRHHKHSYALIMALDIPHWNAAVQLRVACIARYHRKQLPRGGHEGFGWLDKASRRRVRRLAGLLRIADGLDRGHRALVRTLKVILDDRSLRLDVAAPAAAESELCGARRKADLFEHTFGRRVDLYREDA